MKKFEDFNCRECEHWRECPNHPEIGWCVDGWDFVEAKGDGCGNPSTFHEEDHEFRRTWEE